MELTESLYNEDEASTAGILCENIEENLKGVHEMSYDKVSKALCQPNLPIWYCEHFKMVRVRKRR